MTFSDSMIKLQYQSEQIQLCCITNNPQISVNGSKTDLFPDHAICPFLVIRRALFITMTQKLRLMEKSPSQIPPAVIPEEKRALEGLEYIMTGSSSQVTQVTSKPSPHRNWSHGPTQLQEGQEVQSHMCPEGEEPKMFDAQTCDHHLSQEWCSTYPVSVSITWENMWPLSPYRVEGTPGKYLSSTKPGSEPREMGSWNIKPIPSHLNFFYGKRISR